ncbi:TlpA family protein disulfide reductase [Thermodesulfobacterium hydrogeniphilum]|uniref:TlpA family protein disulfide reductase n=1 Tax=Thermodesulfobacterium hydrogeniphilum TaxID=161156 RepID=UPI00056DC70D|nr:TlpA disulfide reductase family protein [Thermodesulfobacterium hydrogeniphilum]
MKPKKFLCLTLIILCLIIGSVSNLQASSLNFDFYTYKGQKYNIADFRGKYVLLNLFASYCPTCMIELGTLNKINNKCSTKNLEIISLMIDKEGIPLLPKIVSSRGIKYTVGLAPSEIFRIFPDFSELPTTYFLNKKGEVIEKITGYKSLNDWIKLLTKYVSCN